MAETEATWALLLVAVLALAVATWFAVRYLLLRRSLRQVDREPVSYTHLDVYKRQS